MNELGTVALAREMASLGPGEALAGWRLTGVISLAVLASLFGYEAYATGRGSEWTNPLVRLWAGLALAFAVFMGHQYFWWFAEHLSAVGNCLHHDPAIYRVDTCARWDDWRGHAPTVTPLFYLVFAVATTLVAAPLTALRFDVREDVGHAVVAAMLFVAGVIGAVTAAGWV